MVGSRIHFLCRCKATTLLCLTATRGNGYDHRMENFLVIILVEYARCSPRILSSIFSSQVISTCHFENIPSLPFQLGACCSASADVRVASSNPSRFLEFSNSLRGHCKAARGLVCRNGGAQDFYLCHSKGKHAVERQTSRRLMTY